jgi:pimeloyl-ACP methyl ester carboxylesterase
MLFWLLCATLFAGFIPRLGSTDFDIFHDETTLADSLDGDIGKDMEAIVKLRGYPIDRHTVTTPDGYILTLFRINKAPHQNQPPVLLQHGLLDSSYTWVNNFAHQSLGFILADQGLDVWAGNSRGNKYGRDHTTLNPDEDQAFWDFSWQDMAEFDLPTVVNYVIETTGFESLGYVGHSQGTTQMFAAGSSSSSYPSTSSSSSTSSSFSSHHPSSSNDSSGKLFLDRINLFVALAPVAYVSNLRSQLLRILAQKPLNNILDHSGLHEFLPDSSGLDVLAPELCAVSPAVCHLFIDQLCGPSTSLNASRIAVYVSETPAGTSKKNIMHWAQAISSASFRKFDYDHVNRAIYGKSNRGGNPEPPRYNLSNFSIPTALFYGGNDYLSDADTDVQQIIKEASPGVIVHVQRIEEYAHLDFVWGVDAHLKIYPQVTALLKKYAAKQSKDEL